ncbi:mitochondrial glyoxalase domain-containing protein 4 (lactoylglutathione lyase) [Andalucia godoyi]|uniref:Mitochondrial glyoxalase domain-containing protein 4 (Lactoylglutathione lyase) n=1 Tax=Andalucia godoyi TaxID=505711 RepID=A0A8K0AJ62_ANDGO|nr:mitochondrial glyoxalase domain-containing protein 4 (lactoylglutathione lyase) [Andalucia godoyi]|eukprot:ANDGO_02866.mRNA.1 mitochondrial glyoxalase domain-containing protein 4 (lactoylglutathione lyase)
MTPIHAAPRALHWVFKVASRKATIPFYTDILRMQTLRHEEFQKGCEAACNGRYDGAWSKTMIGYGSEDDHFVVELTYNYPITYYDLGNDFVGIDISCKSLASKMALYAPDGFRFNLLPSRSSFPEQTEERVVRKITLAATDLDRTAAFWTAVLDLDVDHKSDETLVLVTTSEPIFRIAFDKKQEVRHAESYGRIAFAVQDVKQGKYEERAVQHGGSVLTPFVQLDTPGKASVHVAILGDPDGYEICVVGDAGFRELSCIDPQGQTLLEDAMKSDRSRKE